MHGGFDQQINIVVFSLFQNNDSSNIFLATTAAIQRIGHPICFDLQIADRPLTLPDN
jgi:hypothetical protein